MNETHSSESNHTGDSNQHHILGMIAMAYTVVAGVLLAGLWMATFIYETVPLARVVGLGCYGIAAVGAILHIVVGYGLRRKTRWVDSLVRGTTTAIVIPLGGAVLFFLMLPIQADLNHVLWSIIAVLIAVPWPMFLNYTIQRRA